MRAATNRRLSFNPAPLAVLAASLAVGILLAHVVALPLAVLLAGSVVLWLLAAWGVVRQKSERASWLLVIAFVCMGTGLALLEKEGVRGDRIRRFYEEGRVGPEDPLEVTGVVERAPEHAPDGLYFALRVERVRWADDEQTVTGRVWLFAPVRDGEARASYEALELRRGARLRVMTRLNRAENFRNPGGSSFIEYLERRGFDGVGTIKSSLLIERLDDERVLLPLMWLDEWRGWLMGRMDELFSPETAGVLKAALLGNRYQLSRATAERFREGGTFHVLVISGMHISFIGGLALLLARRITKRRAWQFAASVTLLWAYTIAVGAEASVVRAALMFTIVALAPVLNRPVRTLNALGGAAIWLLVWRPGDLFDPGFQLTFLSVLAIVTLAWPLVARLRDTGAWRPTSATPYPPVAPRWWLRFSEALWWSERAWQRELERATFSYRLFKTGFAAKLERYGVQRVLRYIFVAVIVSISVQLLMLPLFVLYFHRVSIASFLLNVVVGLLMAALSLVALLALVVAQLSMDMAAPLVWLTEKLNWLMTHSVDPFADAGVASVRLPEYTGWPAAIYVLYYVPLIFLIVALMRWNPVPRVLAEGSGEHAVPPVGWRLATLALAGLFVTMVAHPLSAGRPSGRLQIDFLDVGQGDAALVTMPNGTTLLVDGGGRPNYSAGDRIDEEDGAEPFERDGRSIGEAVLSEYLWWRGLDSVDYLLATHAHTDHIDGLNDIAHNFRVRAALVGRAQASNSEYKRFAETMKREGVPVQTINRGDTLRFGEVTAEVLWPVPAPNDASAVSGNDDSVVLRLRFGERTFLLTGDIERAAEAALVRLSDDLRCDVIKVAHHGSRTSSTEVFVQAAHPSLAIISVGLDSPFGHPDSGVLERWRARGTQVWTTGERGTITVSTDGRDLKVSSFVPD